MAGGAAKKSAARQKQAAAVYGGIVLVVNVAYIASRYLVSKEALTRREWTGFLFLAGCYALSLFSLIPAAGVDVRPEASLDLFGLTVLIQLASLWSPRAWWLLALIPAYALYSFGGPLLGLIGMFTGGGGQAGAGDASGAASGPSSKHEEEMEEKRRRRAEHKAKGRMVIKR